MANHLTYDHDSFYLDGKPFRMVSGDVHYFRIHPADWDRRLALCADFGLNTVQTYVPWNAHEPEPGKYCFEGMLDLPAFLAKCAAHGLHVLLRPTPYICSEWDLGGLPAWLLCDREMELRSSDPRFLAAVQRYYDHLLPLVRPYLATNGGPIIAVAVENEYGSYSNDHSYIHALAEMLRAGGVDVPLYTTDGDLYSMVAFGRHRDDLVAVNFRAAIGTSAHAEAVSRRTAPNNPFFTGEFWAGRSMHVGEPFAFRPPHETSEGFRENLKLGGNVNFYMFAGGTNFGFMGGAIHGRSFSPRPGTPDRYLPQMTSYDVDACVHEDGTPSEKYFLCRDVLDDFLGRPHRPRVMPPHPTQAHTVPLTECAPLFDNLDALTAHTEEMLYPRTMEYYGQSYGLILYSQDVDALAGEQKSTLTPENMRDRATFFKNGAYHGTCMRDRGTKDAEGKSVPYLTLTLGTEPTHLDVLVENLGRINYANDLCKERKGLTGIRFGCARLSGGRVRTLPLSDLSGLSYRENRAGDFIPHMPLFLRGRFAATPGVDSYVDVRGLGHGYVWINGFNLGRYDEAGPQYTLYLPGALLREENEVVVLDLAPTAHTPALSLLDHFILEGEGIEMS